MYQQEFNESSVICLHTVKLSNSSLSNNSINGSYLFVLSLYVKQLSLKPLIGPHQVLLIQVTMDLSAMAMKSYSIFLKVTKLGPHHLIVISRTLVCC